MRRMYSEQELTNVIKAVFEQELEDGALDDKVADAVDDYLEEHPVDPTAITGLDIAPKDVTASGNITGDSIIENMSGYAFAMPTTSNVTYDIQYAGVVKNGNKVTFVIAGSIIRTGDAGLISVGVFGIPSAVGSKLYPTKSNWLSMKSIYLANDYADGVSKPYLAVKNSDTSISFNIYGTNALVENREYFFRVEETFLLSDSLAS